MTWYFALSVHSIISTAGQWQALICRRLPLTFKIHQKMSVGVVSCPSHAAVSLGHLNEVLEHKGAVRHENDAVSTRILKTHSLLCLGQVHRLRLNHPFMLLSHRNPPEQQAQFLAHACLDLCYVQLLRFQARRPLQRMYGSFSVHSRWIQRPPMRSRILYQYTRRTRWYG